MKHDELERTLEARALALRSSPVGPEDDQSIEVLVLRAGGERFGLPVAEAEAVIADVAISPLPNLPAPWSGVAHLRGRLVAVADLGRHVGGSPSEVRYVVVLANDDSCALGLELPPLVARIPEADLAMTSRDGTAIARALRGTAPDGTALLDSNDLLDLLASDGRRRQLERI